MRSRPDETRRPSSAPDDLALAAAVRRCTGDPRFLSALREVYRHVDLAVARRGAVCFGGGACCKFDLTDHRLYLSTGELALLVLAPPPAPARCAARRCPYQVGPRCLARARRPLGCRVFFCSPGLADWAGRTYETLHRRIQQIHARHAVPYLYRELTVALADLMRTPRPVTAQDRRASGELPMLFSFDTRGGGH